MVVQIGYVVFVFAFVSFGFSGAEAELLPDYQALSASAKSDILWKQLSADPYPLDMLPTASPTMANMSKIMSPEYLSISFTHTGDEMPKRRVRLIHTYGSVCKVELQIFPNSTYSGVFKSGGIGFLRMSLAQTNSSSFPPGLALKILIDGGPSQNFQLLNNREGQGSNKNFFARVMRNLFNAPLGSLSPVEKAFQASLDILPGTRADKPEDLTNIGCYEQSSVTSDGKNVSVIVAPYLLTLTPNKVLGWDPNDQTDFRVHLAKIPEGSLLYTVALRRNLDEDDTVVGQLFSRSQVLASPYGDQTIFFNHARKSWQP